MADTRTHSSIAERIDIDFNKRPDAWRRARRILNWCGALLPVGLVAWSVVGEDESIYQARPVTTPHGIIQHECQECHQESWQSLKLLAASPEKTRELERTACGSCHQQSTLDHHAFLPERAVQCFECHREHSGRDSLVDVADSLCTDCHANLKEALPRATTTANFFATIDSFSHHPEFAVTDPNRDLSPDSLHLANSLAKREGGQWQDLSPFYFNHKSHLGVVQIPVGHPEYTPTNKSKKLECHACHQLDDEGRYMAPISFERHCQECHPLKFTTKLDVAVAGHDRLAGELPHGSEEAVHGVIRDRLLAYARQNWPQIQAAAPPTSVPARHPNKQLQTAVGRDQYEWAESQFKGFEFDDAVILRGPTGRLVRQGCEFCHQIQDEEPQSPLARVQRFSWSVTTRGKDAPLIPNRWFPHSRFRHDRHDVVQLDRQDVVQLKMDCLSCHAGAATSVSATDILLPELSNCQSCHDPQTTSPTGGHARSHCVECHGYHHVDADAS